EDVKIYSHIDCDGLSAGAILSSTLDNLEIDHDIEFVSLDMLEDLKAENELTIFSDLGSGQELENFITSNSKVLILDHHPPLRTLNQYNGSFLELNPNHYGIDGSYQISGGGMAYLLAKTFGFIDLSWMGVLSAVGDMQDGVNGKLQGLNREILNDSVSINQLHSYYDLSIYGRQTRPLFVALSYFGDVKLPITNNRNECMLLLRKLEIPTFDDGKQRTLYDLNMDEKQRIFSELVRMLSREVPQRYVKHIPQLVSGDAYEFLNEELYTPLRDASEFSTAINACSRNKRHEIALEVLKGNRNSALKDMEKLSRQHRRYLAQKMERFRTGESVKHLDNLQYFSGYDIKSEVIGTIAGMLLSYGDWRKPIIGFTNIGDDKDGIKVSLRCSRLLTYNGIHFGNLIKKVAGKVGGNGGGHSVACGAYIPESKTDDFLQLFDSALNGVV
ncbi:MAG TPA: single-stranded-DNA-specific exonuclease RecJ, partial [Methanobacterium sp.]|nr:single-stranded-DNA-specific exonuclease RecJ [Methanobacterium sp.]